MRLFLHDGPAHHQVLPRSRVREFRDVGAARDFLQPLLADPLNIDAVRRALGVSPAGADVVGELAARIVAEGLQIVTCGEVFYGSLQTTMTSSSEATTPLQDEEAAQAQQETAPAADEVHFIEIELKDDEGKPVAGEAYLIELPDGSQITGRTGSDGKARVDGIDPGTAKVSFPDVDKKGY